MNAIVQFEQNVLLVIMPAPSPHDLYGESWVIYPTFQKEQLTLLLLKNVPVSKFDAYLYLKEISDGEEQDPQNADFCAGLLLWLSHEHEPQLTRVTCAITDDDRGANDLLRELERYFPNDEVNVEVVYLLQEWWKLQRRLT